ncbi:peptidylprolyl isomerase [Thalassotalea hakodatensis]|uniref:peptidylprolyl isomerase n=1 Tax=Thalassotalea hakodatensis TaxID=3030492 RepID=UPI002572633A|nr:peptidylprolyl isomerase [Thalassotalea hakodatensis]
MMIKAILTCLLIICFTTSAKEKRDNNWRILSPENTVIMTLPQGDVVLELSPEFAPNHVKRFKKLVRDGFYQGESFYRVIDGFVAQAGPQDGSDKDKGITPLTIEEEITTDEHWSFTQVQQHDMFAPQTGFRKGFAVGYSQKEQKAWLLHCPGVIAMARESAPNTGTSHFYITNGQAPRYLDRIMTIFGRVVLGMQHVQSIQRTAVIEGMPEILPKQFTPIKSMTVMADLPKAQQLKIAIENTDNSLYENKINKKRLRDNPFFYKKPIPVLDICQSKVDVKVIPQ